MSVEQIRLIESACSSMRYSVEETALDDSVAFTGLYECMDDLSEGLQSAFEQGVLSLNRFYVFTLQHSVIIEGDIGIVVVETKE